MPVTTQTQFVELLETLGLKWKTPFKFSLDYDDNGIVTVDHYAYFDIANEKQDEEIRDDSEILYNSLTNELIDLTYWTQRKLDEQLITTTNFNNLIKQENGIILGYEVGVIDNELFTLFDFSNPERRINSILADGTRQFYSYNEGWITLVEKDKYFIKLNSNTKKIYLLPKELAYANNQITYNISFDGSLFLSDRPSPTWVNTGGTLVKITLQGKNGDENIGSPLEYVGEVTQVYEEKFVGDILDTIIPLIITTEIGQFKFTHTETKFIPNDTNFLQNNFNGAAWINIQMRQYLTYPPSELQGIDIKGLISKRVNPKQGTAADVRRLLYIGGIDIIVANINAIPTEEEKELIRTLYKDEGYKYLCGTPTGELYVFKDGVIDKTLEVRTYTINPASKTQTGWIYMNPNSNGIYRFLGYKIGAQFTPLISTKDFTYLKLPTSEEEYSLMTTGFIEIGIATPKR